jgi:hypothetical protein
VIVGKWLIPIIPLDSSLGFENGFEIFEGFFEDFGWV